MIIFETASRLVLVALAVAVLLPSARTEAVESSPRPGGIVLIDAGPVGETAPDVKYDGRPVLLFRDGGRWTAAIGIPLATAPTEAVAMVEDAPVLFD
ncbi:MAG: hypothetical protein AAFX10_09190, partial [Pseudomonadota bacterium]